MSQISVYFPSIQLYDLQLQQMSSVNELLEWVAIQNSFKGNCMARHLRDRMQANGVETLTCTLRKSNGATYKFVKIDETTYELEIEAIHAIFSKVVLHAQRQSPRHRPQRMKEELSGIAREFCSLLSEAYLVGRVAIPPSLQGADGLERARQGVFAAYLTQVERELKKYPLLSLTVASSPRAMYVKFFQDFRALCEENRAEDRFSLKRLALWHYTQVDLDDALWNLLSHFVPSLAESETLELLSSVADTWKVLVRHPQLDQHLDKEYYFHDLSWVLWKEKRTAFYRVPMVVQYRSIQLSPEHERLQLYSVQGVFRRYLEALSDKRERHAYVNSMNARQQRKTVPCEVQCSQLIHLLQFEYSNFTASTYNRQGPVYDGEFWNVQEESVKGSSEYEKLPEASAYKKLFVEYLFNQEAAFPFVWPLNMKQERWKETTQTIVDQMHAHFFPHDKTIDYQIRDVFNELMLVAALDHYLETEKPEHCNISCLGTIDRGPSFYALLYLFRLRKNGQSIGQKEIRKVLTMLFCPGIMQNNRAMQHPRVVLFLKAAECLMRLPPFQTGSFVKTLFNFFSGFNLKNLFFR